MTSNPTTAPDAADAAIRQTNFEQGVAFSLHLWPALTLAVQDGWGGPDSADKRDWLAGAISDLFPSFQDLARQQSSSSNRPAEDPDVEDVETVLLQALLDEFEVNVDDDSGFEVAGQIVRLRGQCAQGQFDEVEALRTRWQARSGGGAAMLFKRVDDQDEDTDWDTEEDEDGDADMGEAPPLVARQKEEPEVDEEGFTKVTKRKR